MTIYSNILELIGNTPLLMLPVKNSQWELYLKMEKFNPGQSMKDRMALNMINQAENDGLLKPGGVIIESSSGNTAIGLAMVAAIRNYRFIAVVDHHASKEKIDIIKAYGGEIHYINGKYAKDEVAVAEREITAERLSKEIPNSFFPAQAHNLNNREAYPNSLGQELIDDLGKVNILIAAVGTGGSLCGTAYRLKKQNPQIKIIAIEPKGSIIFGRLGGPYFQSGTGNPPGAEIPKNIDYDLIDENYCVTDQEAFNTSRYLARRKGILIGGSGGGVVYKALEKIKNMEDKKQGKMVVIIPDGGEKYLSTVFDDKWMEKNKLLDLSIEKYLSLLID